jgi:hypothetical protein
MCSRSGILHPLGALTWMWRLYSNIFYSVLNDECEWGNYKSGRGSRSPGINELNSQRGIFFFDWSNLRSWYFSWLKILTLVYCVCSRCALFLLTLIIFQKLGLLPGRHKNTVNHFPSTSSGIIFLHLSARLCRHCPFNCDVQEIFSIRYLSAKFFALTRKNSHFYYKFQKHKNTSTVAHPGLDTSNHAKRNTKSHYTRTTIQ